MPELPEVETVVRMLRPLLTNRTFTDARTSWPRHIDRPAPSELKRRINGRSVQAVTRRGKYIVIHLSGNETLIVHLRMSGHLSVSDADKPVSKHTHTVFTLDNGQELRFRDTRKFGRVWLVKNPDDVLGKLGPEPLEDSFTIDTLKTQFQGRKRILKSLLLDQSVIAGIGNIYADEALFYAALHPTRRSDSLKDAEIVSLYKGIRKALSLGLENEGASIDSYRKPDGEMGDMQNILNVYGRTDHPCYLCDEPIQRIIVGQRSTHFCPICQRA